MAFQFTAYEGIADNSVQKTSEAGYWKCSRHFQHFLHPWMVMPTWSVQGCIHSVFLSRPRPRRIQMAEPCRFCPVMRIQSNRRSKKLRSLGTSEQSARILGSDPRMKGMATAPSQCSALR